MSAGGGGNPFPMKSLFPKVPEATLPLTFYWAERCFEDRRHTGCDSAYLKQLDFSQVRAEFGRPSACRVKHRERDEWHVVYCHHAPGASLVMRGGRLYWRFSRECAGAPRPSQRWPHLASSKRARVRRLKAR